MAIQYKGDGTYQLGRVKCRIDVELLVDDDLVIQGTGHDVASPVPNRDIVGLFIYEEGWLKAELLFIVPGGNHCDVLYTLSRRGEAEGKYFGTWMPVTHFGERRITSGPHENWKAEEFYTCETPLVVPPHHKESPAGLELKVVAKGRRVQFPSPKEVAWLIERSKKSHTGDKCVDCGVEAGDHIR